MQSRNAATRLGISFGEAASADVLGGVRAGVEAAVRGPQRSAAGNAVVVCDLTVELLNLLPTGMAQRLVSATNNVVRWADQRRVPVVFTRMELSGLAAQPSPGRHKLLQTLHNEGMLQAGSPGAAFHPDLEVSPAAFTLPRPKLSPFYGTALDAVLRTRGVTDVVITGISTSGAVMATARDAADHDYGVTVLSDAVGNANTRAHRTIMEDVLPITAHVVSSAAWFEEMERLHQGQL